VLDEDRAAQPKDVLTVVRALDAGPPLVLGPGPLERRRIGSARPGPVTVREVRADDPLLD
jgi:hypothetical protein